MAFKVPRVVFYLDRAHEYRWRLLARNGRIIADSAEGYKTMRAARHGWILLAENAYSAAMYTTMPSGKVYRL